MFGGINDAITVGERGIASAENNAEVVRCRFRLVPSLSATGGGGSAVSCEGAWLPEQEVSATENKAARPHAKAGFRPSQGTRVRVLPWRARFISAVLTP